METAPAAASVATGWSEPVPGAGLAPLCGPFTAYPVEPTFSGTIAYIRAAFSEGAAERKVWGALLSLLASKDQVGWVWDTWLSERLKKHSKTDSRIELRVVRLAADGVWLERIMNAKSKNLKGVEESLIEMTRIR